MPGTWKSFSAGPKDFPGMVKEKSGLFSQKNARMAIKREHNINTTLIFFMFIW
jgi:hypothetical protein